MMHSIIELATAPIVLLYVFGGDLLPKTELGWAIVFGGVAFVILSNKLDRLNAKRKDD